MHTFRYEHGPLPAGTVGPRDGRAEGLDLQRMLELRRPDRRLSAMDRRMIDRGTCSGADRSLTMR